MKKYRQNSHLFFVASFLLLFLVAISVAGGPIKPGERLPTLALRDLKGQFVYLHELCKERVSKGEPCAIVINIFKRACKPCEKEFPALVKFANDFTPKGVRMVMIGHHEKINQLEHFFSGKQPDNIIVLSDPHGNVLRLLKVRSSVPRTYVVDKDYILRRVIIGGSDKIYEELAQTLSSI